MKRVFLIICACAVFAGGVHAQAPTKPQLDALIDKLRSDVDAFFAPASTSTVVTSNLQAAINSATVGATLTFSYGETAAITIPKTLTLKGTGGAALRGGLTIIGGNVTIDGAAISAPPSRSDVVILQGDNTKLLNVTVTGAPTGQKRGIAGNARGFYFSKVSVTGFWLPDQDSQAFACWDNCQDGVIEDSVFSGAGETFLVGGADHASQSRMPKNITIRQHSILTKDIAWRRPGVQVKNTLELKCIDGFTIEDSVIENSWQNAQDGYLMVLTPRNQDGANPWCTVSNVLIQRNTGGHAAALLNVSGDDDTHPSARMANVKVIDNAFVDIAPSIWRSGSDWGSGFMVLIQRGPASFAFDRNSVAAGPPLAPFDGKQTGSVVYFGSLPPCGVCSITGNRWPKSQYGIFGADVSADQVWSTYVASGSLAGNVEQ